MKIAENVAYFRERLKGTNCRLVAISKTKTEKEILDAYHAGQKLFGENKVQELTAKSKNLPADIEWHMVGHLQSNKVKNIAPFISLIHSVDSWKLLSEINKQGGRHDRTINCLLQVHIAEEETKFGLSREELYDILDNKPVKELANVKILGLMGMATFTDDKEQVRKEFRTLRKEFEKLKDITHIPNISMQELSMGMSNDYEIALEEGSTLIRVGSAVFGERDYY